MAKKTIKTMETVMVPVADLKPAEYNPRQATKEQMASLKASLRRFGFVDPVIANSAKNRKNVVIGGHMRLLAATELGIAEVPVVYVDLPDEDEERELNIRLNKNTGSWDFDKLMEFDKDLLLRAGWEDKEIQKLLDVPTVEDDNFDVAGAVGDGKPAKTKPGEIWQLGRHRLMCGDSTKRACVEDLMGGGNCGHALHRSTVWCKVCGEDEKSPDNRKRQHGRGGNP